MKKDLPNEPKEYHINGTKYTVKSVFSKENKEDLVAKIRRLILSEKLEKQK